jgi:phosphohistidine phosphatase
LEPISTALGLQERTRFEPGLYTATAEQLLARIRNIEPTVTSALLIGHNPALQDLALELAGDDPEIRSRLWEKLPTGALTVVDHDGDVWADLASGTAHITSLVYPRDLPS